MLLQDPALQIRTRCVDPGCSPQFLTSETYLIKCWAARRFHDRVPARRWTSRSSLLTLRDVFSLPSIKLWRNDTTLFSLHTFNKSSYSSELDWPAKVHCKVDSASSSRSLPESPRTVFRGSLIANHFIRLKMFDSCVFALIQTYTNFLR